MGWSGKERLDLQAWILHSGAAEESSSRIIQGWERLGLKVENLGLLQERGCCHLYYPALLEKVFEAHTRVEEGGQGECPIKFISLFNFSNDANLLSSMMVNVQHYKMRD